MLGLSNYRPHAVVIAVVLLLGEVWAAAAPQPAPSAASLAVEHLQLTARIDYGAATLTAECRLRLRARGTTDTPVRLLLNRLLRAESAEVGGRPAPLEQAVTTFVDDPMLQVNEVRVTLPHRLAAGEAIEIVIRYSGHLVGYTETGSLYIRDRIDEAFTIIRTDAFALPVVSAPSRKEMRATAGNRFTFDLQVTVPTNQVVAAGGRLVGVEADGANHTFHFASDEQVPFVYVVIAPYRIVEAGGVKIYYFPADEAGARRLLAQAQRALALLHDWLGALDQPRGITVIEIPADWGSQADRTAGVLQTADAFQHEESLQELYHELSHFWNPRDLDAPSCRWNEGLAMLLQAELDQELGGTPNATERLEARLTKRLLSHAMDEPRLATVPLRDYGREEMTDFSYTVAMLFFRRVEKAMTRDAFFAAYRRYFAAHQRTGGTLSELVTELERDGGPPVTSLVEEWVNSTAWLQHLRASSQAGAENLVPTRREATRAEMLSRSDNNSDFSAPWRLYASIVPLRRKPRHDRAIVRPVVTRRTFGDGPMRKPFNR